MTHLDVVEALEIIGQFQKDYGIVLLDSKGLDDFGKIAKNLKKREQIVRPMLNNQDEILTELKILNEKIDMVLHMQILLLIWRFNNNV